MRFAPWLLAALAGAGAEAAAADADPARAIRVVGAQESVSVPLPADWNGGEPGATLLLELDGYDVAAISRIVDGHVEIPLAGLALEPGAHQLVVLAARANGDIDTVAEHTLDVYAREGVRASAQSSSVLLGTRYRAADHPDAAFDGTARSQQRAALRWSGEIDRSSWVAGGEIDLLFDDDRGAVFDGDRWQMPTVRLRVGRQFAHGRVMLAFGDTDAAENNLIFGNFQRRGLSVAAEALDGRLAAQTFTLHAEPVTSFDAQVPPFDDDQAVLGAHATLAPLAGDPDLLRFAASWLDGDSTLGGAGVFVADEPGAIARVGGDAATFVLESLPLARAVWLRGEYARAHFDADGIDFGAPARAGTARRLVAQVASGGALRIPALEQWSLGVERQRVSPRFYTLGNPLLPNDLDYRQIHASAASRGFGLRARWLEQYTDVDDAPQTPRIDSRQRSVALDWTPTVADPTAGAWRWLGTPTLRLAGESTDNAMRRADVPIAAYDLDNRQRSVAAGVDFTHERFTVGFSFDRVRRDDRSQALIVDDFVVYEPTPDSRERLYGVAVSWVVNERLTLTPQWQRSRKRELAGGTFDNDLWSLQVQAELIPGVMRAQFGWSAASDRQTYFELPQDAQRQNSSTGNLEVSYRLPLVTFQLRGAYGRNALRSALLDETDSQWQALLGVEFNWERSR